jgi:hypothetical protein
MKLAGADEIHVAAIRLVWQHATYGSYRHGKTNCSTQRTQDHSSLLLTYKYAQCCSQPNTLEPWVCGRQLDTCGLATVLPGDLEIMHSGMPQEQYMFCLGCQPQHVDARNLYQCSVALSTSSECCAPDAFLTDTIQEPTISVPKHAHT